jgi:hypothetical protein
MSINLFLSPCCQAETHMNFPPKLPIYVLSLLIETPQSRQLCADMLSFSSEFCFLGDALYMYGL